jgi:glycosyltransferase involved in cell wall biosynthesis
MKTPTTTDAIRLGEAAAAGTTPFEWEKHLANASTVLDCRWLGYGGAGRATELLLDQLRANVPPGEWVLWGEPQRIGGRAFPGARIVPTAGDPRRVFGQRTVLSVPRADIVLYMHQIRPLRPGRSVTLIYDTIPLRYGGRALARRAKRVYLSRVAAASTRLLTASSFSRDAIIADLGVPPDRIDLISFPVDELRGARVAGLRRQLEQERTLLYIGRFDTHKNLQRLCASFAASAFAASGGRLLLVGGWGDEAPRLRRWLLDVGIGGVEPRGTCSEEELDRLLAVSKALIMPSLEEGYGLPAFEAAAAGLPVAASRTGAMMLLPPEAAVFFDPASGDSMTQAIDLVTQRPTRSPSRIIEASLREPILRSLSRALSGEKEA